MVPNYPDTPSVSFNWGHSTLTVVGPRASAPGWCQGVPNWRPGTLYDVQSRYKRCSSSVGIRSSRAAARFISPSESAGQIQT